MSHALVSDADVSLSTSVIMTLRVLVVNMWFIAMIMTCNTCSCARTGVTHAHGLTKQARILGVDLPVCMLVQMPCLLCSTCVQVWQLRGRYPNRGYPKIFDDKTVLSPPSVPVHDL